MIINVAGLPQGRTIAESRERPETLGFEPEDWRVTAPILVHAEITRMGFDVYIDMKISTKVELTCGRCLEPYETDISIRDRILFVPAKEGSQGRTAEGGVFLYRNSEIDLADRIWELVREAIPMKPLCKADCKGLCPHCGTNLNEGPCDCVESDDTFHPFADFQQYWKNRKQPPPE